MAAIWPEPRPTAGAPCSVPDCTAPAAVIAGSFLLCARHALGCARHAVELGRELDDAAVVERLMNQARD